MLMVHDENYSKIQNTFQLSFLTIMVIYMVITLDVKKVSRLFVRPYQTIYKQRQIHLKKPYDPALNIIQHLAQGFSQNYACTVTAVKSQQEKTIQKKV